MKKWLLLCVSSLMITLVGCQTPVVEEDNLEEQDTIAPLITLIGTEEVYLTLGATYNERGVTVTDNVDFEVPYTITSEEIDTSDYGVYTISYDAIDEAGNIAQTVERTVYVAKQKPGILSSYVYETCDRVGFSVSIFDWDDNIVSLVAYLYDGDTLLDQYNILEGERSFSFVGLTLNSSYTYRIQGSYDLGGDLGIKEFEVDPLTVGTYRTLNESYRERVNDDEKFGYIQELILMPFDPSNDIFIKEQVMELFTVETEFLALVRLYADEKVVYVDGPITSTFEYAWLRGMPTSAGGVYDNVAGVCCGPIAIDINYGGTGVLLHELGHAVDFTLGLISYKPEFQSAFDNERYNLFPDTSYLTWYNEEYFAETFEYYYLSDNTRQILQDEAPETYAFMASLYSKLELNHPELFE